MAYGQFTNKHAFATDAEYRAWALKFSNVFLAAGFVKHWSNVDWSTALKPTAPNQSSWSEVWRFDDDLQATKPVFIKVWYGTSESYTNIGGLWVQVSNGVDGAGNLNGNISSVQRKVQFGGSSSYDYIDWQNFYSGGEGNRLAFFMNIDNDWLGQNYVGGGFAIERTRNADGTVNGDGVAVFFWHYSSGGNGSTYKSNQVLDFVDNIPHGINREVAAMNVMYDATQGTFYNGQVSTIPIYPCKLGSVLYNPLLSILGCMTRDYVDGLTTEINHYGVERTYMKIYYAGENFKPNCFNETRASTRMLILWE